MKEFLGVPGSVHDPVAPSPSEVGEKLQSLRAKRSGLQNLIDFKEMKKASEEEMADFRRQLE
ncbi:MAG: hypothetical protein HGA33_03015 [Candidatus Moranbacteria bacterium]|nr:hypothetical protein [Candidatus Moranbacteria bacterium]